MELVTQAITNITDSSTLTIDKTVTSPVLTITDFVYDTYTVPISTTDYQLELGRIAHTSHILIQTNQTIDVKLGATTNTPITISTFLSVTTSTDKVYITNNSTTLPATVFVLISGTIV